MIKVVAFDLGNVLFDFDPLRAARGFLKLTGHKKNPFDVLKFFQESPVETAYCEGRVTTDVFINHVVEALKINDIESLKKCYCDIFVVNIGTFNVADEVKKQGVRRLILSNTNELHYDYLCDFNPQLREFDDVVLSYKEQCQKPQERIYSILIEKAGCEPEEIFFTDDLKENVEAAEKMGIQTHHFKNEKSLREELINRNVLV
ncbi:HAD family hydrolase [Candidatus Omnitrophota bacterium]